MVEHSSRGGWMEKEKVKKEGRGTVKWPGEGRGERDVSWRPTLRGKRSGLPGVPWETDLVAESEFHLRRTKDLPGAHTTILQRIPCSVQPPLYSLAGDKTNELPSDKTTLLGNVNDTSIPSVGIMSNYQGCFLLHNWDEEILRLLKFIYYCSSMYFDLHR